MDYTEREARIAMAKLRLEHGITVPNHQRDYELWDWLEVKAPADVRELFYDLILSSREETCG